MDHGVFCYPWDIVGDPEAADRLAGLGVPTVTLAAAYHSVRAMTPRHPAHRVVQAHHAAAYFPVRPEVWRDRRLRPARPAWGVPDQDPFGTAARALSLAGLRVEAWVVLTHNTRLGLAFPELSVRNTFGDRYPHALCPAHPEVREYATTLVREVSTLYDLSGVVLEACGWLGFDHGGHHDKTGTDLTSADRELLSVCACDACAKAVTRSGLHEHRASVIEDLLGGARRAAGEIPITLMATDGLAHTGPDAGVDLAAFETLADSYLLKCWGDQDAAVAQLAAARGRTGIPLVANVNILEPGNDDPGVLSDRLARLREAGADAFRYYHAGLASSARHQALTVTVR